MSITTALKARREQLRDREAGFTLIELLVVVIIIGILAAIAIPVYIGVQNNAKDSAVQSDLTNIKTAEVSYFTTKGSYTTTTSDLTNYGYTSSGTTAPSITLPTGGGFCATKAGTGTTTFYISDTKQLNTTSC
jgi:prepilin-type N-terminal cleavage/methylation domain-containing protein